jgi:hypothetical protein
MPSQQAAIQQEYLAFLHSRSAFEGIKHLLSFFLSERIRFTWKENHLW